ncbi:MAG: hypothetical protein JWP25_3585 [Bradyrhizobium sp.]|nr:hypothetical protein [Bradyrhizobium sp.]
MPDSTLRQLRNVILLEADHHQLHALWLNEQAKRAGSGAPALNNAAARFRDRARHLHEVLAASEPKAEAS